MGPALPLTFRAILSNIFSQNSAAIIPAHGATMSQFPSFELSSQVSHITGAARRLGRALSLALSHASDTPPCLRDASGASGLVRDIQSMARKALPLQMDVTDLAQISSAMQRAADHFGNLDILVNNAGNGTSALALDVNEHDFDLTLALNLKSTFFASQAAAKLM